MLVPTEQNRTKIYISEDMLYVVVNHLGDVLMSLLISCKHVCCVLLQVLVAKLLPIVVKLVQVLLDCQFLEHVGFEREGCLEVTEILEVTSYHYLLIEWVDPVSPACSPIGISYYQSLHVHMVTQHIRYGNTISSNPTPSANQSVS